MKRLLIAGAVAALLLAGCAKAPGPDTDTSEGTTPDSGTQTADTLEGYLSEGSYTLADGRTITCIILNLPSDKGQGGGLSCDWDGAR